VTKNELILLNGISEIQRILKEDCHWRDSRETWCYNADRIQKVARKTLRKMPDLLSAKKREDALRREEADAKIAILADKLVRRNFPKRKS